MRNLTPYTDTEKPFIAGRHKGLLLPIILCAALLLRLVFINQPYTDLAGWRQTSVAMMADNFHHRNPNIFFPEISWNGPGESYNGREFQTISYISSLLYKLVGQHDWVGRLVAALFGVWGVFALYHLVRRTWSEKHALATAAVMTIMPCSIYFERSFLPDPAMVSLATTSLWMMVAYLQTDRTRYLLLALAFACWSYLTKITGMLTLLPMLYAILTILHQRNRLSTGNITRIILPGLLVIVIVAGYYLWARYLSNHYPPFHFAGSDNWVWDDGLNSWLQQQYFLPNLSFIFKNWMLGWPFILLFVAGIFVSFFQIRQGKTRNAKHRFTAPYLFHFWLAGCLIFYSIGAKEIIWNFWNFHIWSPMIAAFCGSTLVALVGVVQKQKLLALAAAISLLAWIAFSNYQVIRRTYTSYHYLSDYRMGMRLRQLRQSNDLVVVLAREIGCPIAIYYSQGRGWVFPPAGDTDWSALPPTDAANIALLEQLRRQGAEWFGIYQEQYKLLQKSYPGFANYLQTHFHLQAQESDFIIYKLK